MKLNKNLVTAHADCQNIFNTNTIVSLISPSVFQQLSGLVRVSLFLAFYLSEKREILFRMAKIVREKETSHMGFVVFFFFVLMRFFLTCDAILYPAQFFTFFNFLLQNGTLIDIFIYFRY